MLSEIREKVIEFMESDEYLSKLKDEKWYKMEDKLVGLCEKVSGKKDTTYREKDYERIIKITNEWVGSVATDDEIENFAKDIIANGCQYFGDIMPLVNKYFGWCNTDGEIDGLAMDIEEYFEEQGE